MMTITWVRGLLTRRSGRLLTTAAGVAVAVALLATIGSFLSASQSTMTQRSITRVAVDWQVQAQPGADPSAVLAGVAAQPGVTTALPVGFGPATGFTATTAGTTQTTGPGVVLGLPDGYRTTFPQQIRDLGGAGTGVLVAQQTAANLRVAPGDQVTIGLPDGGTTSVSVDGVIDLPQADSLFQTVGAPVGAQPQAPPDNVLLLPGATWHGIYDPLAATTPAVFTQIHATVDHDLPSDPAAAYTEVTGRAQNLEVTLAGSGRVGDNLAATLGAARSDALYAQVLFLFLGLPGAVLAGLLTAAVAGAAADRRRGEQALLRTRGATSKQLVALGIGEAAVVGGIGAVAGLLTAQVIGRIAFDASATTAVSATIGWQVGAAVIGLVIAIVSIAIPAWRDARETTVVGARRRIRTDGPPRWLRFGLDVILLTLSALVFWLTSRNGYKLVLAPEGTPQISVNYWAFAGPALLWLGSGLFLWRIAFWGLLRGRGALARVARPALGGLSSVVASSATRQRRLLARSLVLVALTVTFAASTAVFNATYRQQAEVDAILSNGADVTVTESPGVVVGPDAGKAIAATPGVASVEPIQHRFAYVGADLQDLYGVRPDTIVAATRLQDAYFDGGTARGLMMRLAQQPDSVLVSAETVRDFQLAQGDRITLQLQDGRTKQFTPVDFVYAGVANEFPTAPSDSFLVANADYVAQQTGSAAVGAFLVSTPGADPSAVATTLRTSVGTSASVTAIGEARRVIGSSLTAVDLAGLTRVELGFALVLAAASTGMVLGLGFAERRRFFAIMSALGARGRQLGGFVWSEAVIVAAGGLLGGTVAGWALSQMLVKVLTGVFDPAPSSVAVPWLYLSAVVVTGAVAVTVAGREVIRRAGHATPSLLRGS